MQQTELDRPTMEEKKHLDKYNWDGTITCISCGIKKHIGIDEGIDVACERINLIDFEEKKAKCCSKPNYYMYPLEKPVKESKANI